MTLTIRQSKLTDLPRLMDIYAAAIRYMRAYGNSNQWTGGYPSENVIKKDINNGVSFCVLNGDKIAGVFSMIPGEDPTYRSIEGKWLNDELPYLTIHRIASDGSTRGIAKAAFDYAQSLCASVRVDTHADNTKMRQTIIDNGFKYCGIIHLLNGEPRLAYQTVKHDNEDI